jgi:phytoene synthase
MSLTYCGNLVRQQDPDRFLLSLFAPIRARPALWALYAFNYEIAKTREVVTETTTGLIRLTWWREAIAEIYSGAPVRQHEVVMALAEAVRAHDLPQEKFDALVYAREFDVEDRAPATLEGLFHYADYTTTPLNELSLKALRQEDDGARETSIRYAVTGLLRAVPYMTQQRRCYLPDDVMAAHGTSAQKLFDFNERQKLPEVVRDIIRALPDAAPTSSKHLHKMNKMTALYISQIEKASFNVFDKSMAAPPALMGLRLFF